MSRDDFLSGLGFAAFLFLSYIALLAFVPEPPLVMPTEVRR